MNFPVGVIYIWTSTNATIPSGWERVTALDGRYPKGTANATNPNGTGGASTHTHTGTTHSHTMASHTHSVRCNECNYTNENLEDETCMRQHYHSTTSSASSGGNLSSVSCTYAAYSNDPLYYTVIFIQPSSAQSYFPSNGVYLYDGTDAKIGHYLCNGSNSTPNLVDKYLKGASTGANAGGTGGSTTNVHTLTHTHTVASHNHGTFNSGTPSETRKSDWWGGSSGGVTNTTHQHSLTLSDTTASISSTVPSLTTAETVEPAYKKLLTVQNQNTGSTSYRLGMIGMWLGTLVNIPANYSLCDGTNGTQDMRGKHLKSTSTTSSVGSTGGSNTHTHASQNHNHTASGTHTHTHANVNHDNSDWYSTGGGPQSGEPHTAIDRYHYHTVSVGTATPTYANASTSGASSSNEPSYRTVAFIKLTAWEIDGEESITVSESLNNTLVHNTIIEETTTVSEFVDETIRAGKDRNISIWRDTIKVTDIPEFPGPRDLPYPAEHTSVSERVTIKITNETNEGHKPGFNVEY